jgi:ATP-dependent protease HslVU (ClpYQ) peptidase subunit
MTTIAASKYEITSDRQLNCRDGVKLFIPSKIHRLGETSRQLFNTDDSLVAFTGAVNDWGKLLTYIRNPKGHVPKFKDLELLLLTEQKLYTSTDFISWKTIDNDYHSIGTGRTYALSALADGSSTADAVCHAIGCDKYSGLGITTEVL